MSLPGDLPPGSHGVQSTTASGITPLAPLAYKESLADHPAPAVATVSPKVVGPDSQYGSDEKGSVAPSDHLASASDTQFVNGEPVVESGECTTLLKISCIDANLKRTIR